MKAHFPHQLSYLSLNQWAEMPFELIDFNIKKSWLNECIGEVKAELKAKNIPAFFHTWVSDEWFSPDGCPGIAIPFYLFHPSLTKLYKSAGLPVEGITKNKALKLIRHEVGHAIENAWRLRRKKTRQKIFGNSTTPYPNSYRPCLETTDYVQHLGDCYSQSHPDEDWAETFAVWLGQSASSWKRRYAGTFALEKLEYCDAMMKEIAGTKPLNNERFIVSPIEDQKGTIKQLLDTKSKQRLRTIVKAVRMPKNSQNLPSADILKHADSIFKRHDLGFLM